MNQEDSVAAKLGLGRFLGALYSVAPPDRRRALLHMVRAELGFLDLVTKFVERGESRGVPVRVWEAARVKRIRAGLLGEALAEKERDL